MTNDEGPAEFWAAKAPELRATAAIGLGSRAG